MKTILASAYAMHPMKGSEDGTGWNLAMQIARFNKVIVITRKNNREAIESWLEAHPATAHANIDFRYYDLPIWMRWWKKGGRGAMVYFYLWQLFLPLFVRWHGLQFDIAHNLNFHNNWTPSFLWLLGKPLVWGPVGHHPPIPKQFIRSTYGKYAWTKNRLNAMLKKMFWRLDPFLAWAYRRADKVICINSSAPVAAGIAAEKVAIMPAVGAVAVPRTAKPGGKRFRVLTVGRFVPLKGFDVALEAFADFYGRLPVSERQHVSLHVVGKGPEQARLKALAERLGLQSCVEFIAWMPQSELRELYGQSHLFLFPSHEGAGMVVPEALSYGLPVLAFDNCGPGELIDTSCGFRIPYLDYQASVTRFSAKLYALYSDPELRNEMSENARRFHAKNLTWDAKGPRLAKIYQSLST